MLEKGVDLEQNATYFQKRQFRYQKNKFNNAKILKLNATDLYLVGGRDSYPALISRTDFKVRDSCIKINLTNGELTLKAKMLHERNEHGICSIGQYIYCIGGSSKPKNSERFNVLQNRWKLIPGGELDENCLGFTCTAIKQRFIYTFGCVGKKLKRKDMTTDKFMRLDVLKMSW